jgi:hypothetical protein
MPTVSRTASPSRRRLQHLPAAELHSSTRPKIPVRQAARFTIPPPAGPRPVPLHPGRQPVEQLGIAIHVAVRQPDHQASARRSAGSAPRPSRSDRPSRHPAAGPLDGVQDRVCLRPLRRYPRIVKATAGATLTPGNSFQRLNRHPPLSSTVSISAFAVFRLTAMSSGISTL